jgi:hypothetical protein
MRIQRTTRTATMLLLAVLASCTDLTAPGEHAPQFKRKPTAEGASVVPGDLVRGAGDAPALASTCPASPPAGNGWAVSFGKSGCLIITPEWASSSYAPYPLTDDVLINVRVESGKNGRITHVRIYAQDVNGEAGIAHQSDWIPVETPVVPSKAGFVLHVHAKNVQIWRLDSHLAGGNRVEMIGTVSIGDVIYPPR